MNISMLQRKESDALLTCITARDMDDQRIL